LYCQQQQVMQGQVPMQQPPLPGQMPMQQVREHWFLIFAKMFYHLTTIIIIYFILMNSFLIATSANARPNSNAATANASWAGYILIY